MAIVLAGIKNLPLAMERHRFKVVERLGTLLPNLKPECFPVAITQFRVDGQWKAPKNGDVIVDSINTLSKIISDGITIYGHEGWCLYFVVEGSRVMPDVFAKEFASLPTLAECDTP